jgi:hypothetical protein
LAEVVESVAVTVYPVISAPPFEAGAVNHTTAERLKPTAVTAVGASATAALADGAMTTIDTATPSTAIAATNREPTRRAIRFEPRGAGEVKI